MPNMKTPLTPSLQSALAEVAAIADGLAETSCVMPSAKMGGMSVSAVLDNLDHVASCLTLAELEHAPAMLNAAARAFRQTFDGMTEGYAAAGRLESIAYMIELHQTAAASGLSTDAQWAANAAWNYCAAAEAAVVKAETLHGWQSIQAADARSAYQAARGKLFRQA